MANGCLQCWCIFEYPTCINENKIFSTFSQWHLLIYALQPAVKFKSLGIISNFFLLSLFDLISYESQHVSRRVKNDGESFRVPNIYK